MHVDNVMGPQLSDWTQGAAGGQESLNQGSEERDRRCYRTFEL